MIGFFVQYDKSKRPNIWIVKEKKCVEKCNTILQCEQKPQKHVSRKLWLIPMIWYSCLRIIVSTL